MMKGTGFLYSTPNPNDQLADNLIKFAGSIPDEYKLKYPDKIVDQGARPICVSCVAKDMVDFKNRQKGIQKEISLDYVYNLKANKSENGMSPREAFQILTRTDNSKIYAKVGNLLAMKRAILTNGPVLVAMIVKSWDSDFWNGSQNYGGHAVSVVGWNKNELIIKNSWGYSYGDRGYGYLPLSEFSNIIECWTLIG